jgi:hypothetical protein
MFNIFLKKHIKDPENTINTVFRPILWTLLKMCKGHLRWGSAGSDLWLVGRCAGGRGPGRAGPDRDQARWLLLLLRQAWCVLLRKEMLCYQIYSLQINTNRFRIGAFYSEGGLFGTFWYFLTCFLILTMFDRYQRIRIRIKLINLKKNLKTNKKEQLNCFINVQGKMKKIIQGKNLFLQKKNILKAVLRIRIRNNPDVLAGSESEKKIRIRIRIQTLL